MEALMGMPGLSDDGRDGTLFGQRVSAEFVMVLIAQLGGRVEVNMWVEIDRMHRAGVRIIAQPKFSIAAPDVYRLVDRNGQPWPPQEEPVNYTVTQERPSDDTIRMIAAATGGKVRATEVRPVLEGEIVEEGEDEQD